MILYLLHEYPLPPACNHIEYSARQCSSNGGRRDVFSAGASHYGVADLALLSQETHKFESRYLDGLVGPYPQAAALYKERSPIEALDKFDKPVAFFQVDC